MVCQPEKKCVYYYPKMKLEYCQSEPTFDAFGMDKQTLYYTLISKDWTNETTTDWVISTINKGKTREYCNGEHFQSPHPQPYHPTETANPYVPLPANCS